MICKLNIIYFFRTIHINIQACTQTHTHTKEVTETFSEHQTSENIIKIYVCVSEHSFMIVIV